MSEFRSNKHWTQTAGIRQFFPLDPKPEEVFIDDIRQALSRIGRYNGHTVRHYSVAQHSVLVSQIVEALGGTFNEQRWGLLHDAAEAFIGDMPAPLKNHPLMKPYQDAEDKILGVIAQRFGLEGPEPDIVKMVDRQMVIFEASSPLIISGRHPNWTLPEGDTRIRAFFKGFPIEPWGVSESARRFTERFEALGLD